MGGHSGYLLGKVQLEKGIGTELLANVVSTLLAKHQLNDLGRKQGRFLENLKYFVECTERGLKLTSTSFRGKDEGFESDSECSTNTVESIDVINHHESASSLLDQNESINIKQLNIEINNSRKGFDVEGNGLCSGNSKLIRSTGDNTSLSSSSNVLLLDDSNSSSSGNGSDSDEFTSLSHQAPTWFETSLSSMSTSTLSPFYSYPIEEIIFCHTDSTNPKILVWIMQKTINSKLIALVIYFNEKKSAETLFQTYRELRNNLKPNKSKFFANSIQSKDGSKTFLSSTLPKYIHQSTPPPPPPRTCSTLSTHSFNEIHPTASNPKFKPAEDNLNPFLNNSKSGFKNLSLDEKNGSNTLPRQLNHFKASLRNIPYEQMDPRARSSTLEYSKGNKNVDGTFLIKEKQRNSVIFGVESSESESDDENITIHEYNPINDSDGRSSRKTMMNGFNHGRKGVGTGGHFGKGLLLVPLKTESANSKKHSYPKESYFVHVMGKTNSTFAPYQRKLNIVSRPNHAISTENLWGNEASGTVSSVQTSTPQLLVPFSSWMELSELKHVPPSNISNLMQNTNFSKMLINSKQINNKKENNRNSSSTSSLSHLTGRGTAKILLRDTHQNGLWGNLSQRVKQNLRENLIPKFWTNQGNGGSDGTAIGTKKKTTKKVTFNAWATVQML